MAAPHLSPVVEAGPYVFVSGQLPFDAAGRISGDAADQTRQVLQNLQRVLSSVDLDLLDVFKTTVWLRPGTDFVAFNDAYAAVFGDHKPARSTVYADLALPSAMVEIEAIAHRAR